MEKPEWKITRYIYGIGYYNFCVEHYCKKSLYRWFGHSYCYSCNKSIPSYVIFQLNLLNGK